MAVAWLDAKPQIKTVLEGLSITSPLTLSVKRVYPNPPAAVQDWPSVIINAPAKEISLGSGLRERTYRPKLLFIVSDQDMSQASAIADAFGEALITIFDDKSNLSGTATQCWVENVGEVGGFVIPPTAGGKVFIGFEAFLHVEFKEAVTFS